MITLDTKVEKNATTGRFAPVMYISYVTPKGAAKMKLSLRGSAPDINGALALVGSQENGPRVLSAITRATREERGVKATQVVQPKPASDYAARAGRPRPPANVTEAQRDMYDHLGKPLMSSAANLARANAQYDEHSKPVTSGGVPQKGMTDPKLVAGRGNHRLAGTASIEIETSHGETAEEAMAAKPDAAASIKVSATSPKLNYAGNKRVAQIAVEKGMTAPEFIAYAKTRGVEFQHANNSVTPEQYAKL